MVMEDIRAEQIERLTKAFGNAIRFKEDPQQETEEEIIEDFTLDTLALDRHLAAQKAALQGKSITKSATKSNTGYIGPPLEPSKSEKLAPADFNSLMMQDFPEFKQMKAGEMSQEGMSFVAWNLVQRYHMSFIGKTNRPKTAPFFDAMTEEQTWDFFYIYDPRALDQAPFIFVPTKQFEHFLDVINASIQTKLTIPHGKPGEMFYVTFGSSCTIRPKYIARSASYNEYRAIRESIPPPEEDDACPNATIFGKEMLISLLNLHKNCEDSKSRSKKKKEKKAHNREESLYDAQLYLGLRPTAGKVGDKMKKIELDKPVPYIQDQKVVFVCIDIEVAEEHHGTFLEIGISILDTKKIVGIPPGQIGCNWLPFINNRHLIVDEHRHIQNRKYVKGCPDLFNFGKSEYPKLSELANTIISTLNGLSVSGQEGVPEVEGRYRNIVLLGHDLNTDISYLKNIGVQPWGVNGVMSRTLDTKDMHQVWSKQTQGRSLGIVLGDLGIPHSNLHNAGNDAAYTMQAMLGLAIGAITGKDQKSQGLLEEKQ